MSESLADYLDSELKKMLANFKWKVVKDSKKNMVEIYFTFRAETEDEIQVQDELGQNNDPGSVLFEDVLCFYDLAYAHVKPQNYLAAFSFDSHVGIEKGYIDAILRQLNITTKQGEVALKEFLLDDFAGEFELKWNHNNLETLIKTTKDTGRYDDERIHMVLEDEDSFFEKLTKDDGDDGVERV